ncbi:MAG: tRNA lysidine(34) synthetase [Thermoleophilia bacterium]
MDERPPTSRLAASLRRRAAAFVAAGALLRPGERALLMLSGGADSMALLDIVRAVDRRLGLGLELSALHVDYATRGADSARGEADVVVTAHNRDDQAETVLYRLVKYAAPSSLRAMRPRENGLARPLLCLGASELRAYCAELGIEYGEDESNDTVDYRRNLVRHEVLPVLETINPRVTETLADAAALAVDEHVVVAAAVDAAWARVARPAVDQRGDQSWELDATALRAEPAALRALCLRRLVFAAVGDERLLGRRLTQRLEQLAGDTAGSRAVTLGGGLEAVREYDRLAVRVRAGGHSCPPAVLSPGSSTVFCGRRFRAELITGAAFEATTAAAWLGVGRPDHDVVLRHPRRGDRLRPFGMAGDVLLSDLFAAGRVPRARRPRAVVAELDGRLAWVCPGRSSEWFRVTSGTPYTLHIFEEATEAT